MKLGTSAIPHFHAMLTGQSISKIILIIQSHLQGQFHRKYPFYQVKLGMRVIPLFHGILTEKSIHNIILVILGHLQGHLLNML